MERKTDMNDIYKSLKTPCYIIQKEDLYTNLSLLKVALDKAWGNYAIGYSYKTNSLEWIVRYFNESGCYSEVVSDDEYKLARYIGAENIIYNGIAKTEDSFLDAVKKHAIVNIDAEYEIDWLDKLPKNKYEVGIRVNFDLESKCPGQTQCGQDGERFGFCYENGELKRAIERIESKGVKVTGLHLHKSSKTRMPDIYKAIAEIAVDISKKYGKNFSYLDIGGGFFGRLESKPSFSEYFDMVAGILKQQFTPSQTKLIVEPGMALVGSAVDYISSVVDVKKTTRNLFVITDGSRTQIDPLMTKRSYFHEIIRQDCSRAIMDKQVVAGFTCMEHDRLFELNCEKEILPGDRIIYHKVGAYTMCLSPLFIKWFPDIYLNDGSEIYNIRSKWTTEEYLGRRKRE